MVEFSGSVEQDDMKKELKKLPGNLEPIAFNWEPNIYVIQGSDTRNLIASFKALATPQNFLLCGRFAEWEYYNMDNAIEAAMQLTDHF